jgi:hypothetical protein
MCQTLKNNSGLGETSIRSMRSQRSKWKQALSNFLSLGIVLFAMNSAIDFLKGKMDGEPIVYEVARASKGDVSKDEAVPQIPDHETGELVYTFSGEFTAYSPSVDQTDDRPREMASGKEVYEGALACPDIFIVKDGQRTFGTKIEIEGLGVFTCEDRMAKKHRDKMKFDIFMESYDEAIQFGIHQLNFKVLP